MTDQMTTDTRFDYEGVAKDGATKMMAAMLELQGKGLEAVNTVVQKSQGSAAKSEGGEGGKDESAGMKVSKCDEFTYEDPVTGDVAEHQGIRFIFEDGSRIIFRLSGTGSEGATVRMYLERTVGPLEDHSLATLRAVKPLVDAALELSRLEEFTGRKEPTVIT